MYQFNLVPRKIHYIILLFLVVLSAKAQSTDKAKLDSLEHALSRSNPQQRYDILYSIFSIYYKTSDYDNAFLYCNKAIEQALRIGDSLGIVNSRNGKGLLLKQHGELKEATKAFELALPIAQRNGFTKQVKFLLNNLALSYTLRASYDKALDYNFQSLKIREQEGDPEAISIALNNIGLVYQELLDFENALVYYEKSYTVKTTNNVTYDLERSTINLGVVLNELGQFNRAEEKLKEAIAICDKTKCSEDILVELNQALGVSLLKQGEYGQAEEYFHKSLLGSEKLEWSEYTASNYRWLAVSNYEQEQMKEALELLDQSQKVALDADFRKQILENYLYYSKVYAHLNDYKRASEYQNRYIKLYSDIFNAGLIKNISRIQTDYEEQENIRTIAVNDSVIRQQRIFNWLLTTIIVLTSVLGYVIYRNYKRTKMVNAALASAKRMIEVQNRLLDKEVREKTRELVDTNETLTKVNDELDNFIYKTSHDIRGPLASLKGMVNLAIMDVQDEKAQGYLKKLDITAEKLNAVLTRLLIVNRINHAELKPEPVHFELVIQEILTLEMKKGVPGKIKIEYDVPSDIQLISDKEMLRLILENLIDNALKFYNESERVESFVKIVVKSSPDGRVTAHVMDNGVGISQMNRERIFQMFVRASERSETGGIGLYLAKLATEKLGGEINLVSTDGKYTEFIVAFPKDLQTIINRRSADRIRIEEESKSVVRTREVKQV